METRRFNGKARFGLKVSTYYMEKKHQYARSGAVEQTRVPVMDDPAMAVQKANEQLRLIKNKRNMRSFCLLLVMLR